MEKYKDSTLSPSERAIDLISRMSLTEKVGQLNQRIYGFTSYIKNGNTIELSDEFKQEATRWGGIGLLYGLFRADPWSKKFFENGIYDQNAIKAYNMVQEYVISKSRFSIPALICEECPHGHQGLKGYLLPVNLATGCTWNPRLAEKSFSVCAAQLREMNVDFALISMLDILRDPRWGRSEECYSEDPYLASVMASAVIRAMKEKGIDVVSKHCCAQGETTGGINASAASIGERELREIHLPTVKSAIKAGAKGIMAAYNEIDGIPCHANKWLLKNVLREEFGFDGIIMADGRAIDRLHTLVPTSEECAATALKSGVNVSLWDYAFSTLESAVEQKLIDESLIDESVLKVLTIKFQRGLFENPYIKTNKLSRYTYKTHPQTLQLAEESAVLLKNDNAVLPLNKSDTRISVIGPFADDVYAMLGDYTPSQRSGDTITLLDGLKKISPNETEINAFTSPVPNDCEKLELYIKNAVLTALESDKIILALGGSSSRFDNFVFADNGAVLSKANNGEFLSLTDCGEGVDIADISLDDWQIKLLRALKQTGKPIVTVIIAGRPYAMRDIEANSDGILYSFYPGPAGGLAIANLLFGFSAPSGRLSVSLPNNAGQIPAFYNRKSSYNFNYSDCTEKPHYGFGYGLTYTDFILYDFKLSTEKMTSKQLEQYPLSISFNIKNIGSIKSFAVPQIYISDKSASVVPRVRELKAFDKIEVEPNQTVRCELQLSADCFKIWNADMKFVAEPGVFDIIVYEGTKDRFKGLFEILE